MPDNRKLKRVDGYQINLSEAYERAGWTKALGVTLPELKALVLLVGDHRADVRAVLKTVMERRALRGKARGSRVR